MHEEAKGNGGEIPRCRRWARALGWQCRSEDGLFVWLSCSFGSHVSHIPRARFDVLVRLREHIRRVAIGAAPSAVVRLPGVPRRHAAGEGAEVRCRPVDPFPRALLLLVREANPARVRRAQVPSEAILLGREDACQVPTVLTCGVQGGSFQCMFARRELPLYSCGRSVLKA